MPMGAGNPGPLQLIAEPFLHRAFRSLFLCAYERRPQYRCYHYKMYTCASHYTSLYSYSPRAQTKTPSLGIGGVCCSRVREYMLSIDKAWRSIPGNREKALSVVFPGGRKNYRHSAFVFYHLDSQPYLPFYPRALLSVFSTSCSLPVSPLQSLSRCLLIFIHSIWYWAILNISCALHVPALC